MLILKIHRPQVRHLNARKMLFCLSGTGKCYSWCTTHQTKKVNLSNSNLKQHHSHSHSVRIRHLHLDGCVSSQYYRYWAQHRAWRKQRGRYTWARAGVQTGGWCAINAPGSCGPIGRMVTTGRLWRLTQSGPWEILEWPAQALPPRAEPAAHKVVPAEWHVAPLCNRYQIRLRDHFQERLIAKGVGTG